jgi:outer membrane protein OmpA-like peptidoglycan-associated protein
MNRRTWLLALVLSAGPMTAVPAETPAPALSRNVVSSMLAGSGGDMLTPEALAAILAPPPAGQTRSLKGGGEPPPGSAGSGVVPDLRIQFSTNSAAINRDAAQRLGALATALGFPQMQDVRLIIAGHTDARGSDAMNKALSQRRANAVVEWLVSEGAVAPRRLQAVGFGEERLADPDNPASGVNRRVEVIARQPGPSAQAY